MRRFIQQAASLCIVLAVVSCSKKEETVEKRTQGANGTEQKPGDKPPSLVKTVDDTVEVSSPEEVVRRMANFYKAAKTIEVRADYEVHVQAQGMDNRMTSTRGLIPIRDELVLH